MSESFERLSFARIVESFAARTPTPGGGAAAGLSAAMGASMTAMAMRFSVPKKVDEHPLLTLAAEFEQAAHKFVQAADLDCAAYERVRDAFRLPKESEEEGRIRKEAIHQATLGALKSPLNLMQQSCSRLQVLVENAGEIKDMLASDMISAGWAFRAGCEMAWQNVKINAGDLVGDSEAENGVAEAIKIRKQVEELLGKLVG